MSKTATVKLTAAIAARGEIKRAGTILTIPEDAAKDLLRRGKAVLATEADEPDLDGDESDGDPVSEAPEPETPAAEVAEVVATAAVAPAARSTKK